MNPPIIQMLILFGIVLFAVWLIARKSTPSMWLGAAWAFGLVFLGAIIAWCAMDVLFWIRYGSILP